MIVKKIELFTKLSFDQWAQLKGYLVPESVHLTFSRAVKNSPFSGE